MARYVFRLRMKETASRHARRLRPRTRNAESRVPDVKQRRTLSRVGDQVEKQGLAVNRSSSRSATPGVGHERVLWRDSNTKNNEHDNVDSEHMRFSVLTAVLLWIPFFWEIVCSRFHLRTRRLQHCSISCVHAVARIQMCVCVILRREIVNQNFADSINMAYCMKLGYNSSKMCAMLRSILTRGCEEAKCSQITYKFQRAERT